MIHGLSVLLLFFAVAFGGQAVAEQPRDEEARWKLRLPKEDRSAIEMNLGHALPEWRDDVVWVGASPFKEADALDNHVVVIQSWTHGNSRGRAVPKKLAKTLGPLDGRDDLVVLLLHTPEDADEATTFLTRNAPGFPVAIDATGRTCDAIGAYKRPVNLVVDRQGVIRYAGLHDRGLKSAVEKLLAEPHDPSVTPEPHPTMAIEESPPSGNFPVFKNSVGPAKDLRGQSAPTFVVERWLTPEPSAQGKVAVVDFWATWCGPCVRAIPHMNSLADQFRGRVEFVGISNESLADFNKGLQKKSLAPASFRYNLALDPQARMMSAFAVRGIPHVAVMSSDWVVRWQGNPNSLSSDVLRQIVAADGGTGSSRPSGAPPIRWNTSVR